VRRVRSTQRLSPVPFCYTRFGDSSPLGVRNPPVRVLARAMVVSVTNPSQGPGVFIHETRLTAPRKIMVRATNWIGDAVMSLPALEALQARFPEAEIVPVVKPWVSDVYSHYPPLRRQLVYDPQGEHRGIAGFSRFVTQLRTERFDAAILFQNAFHAAWMAWRARIPSRLGYARDGRSHLLTEAVDAPPPAAYGHQAFYYLHLLFRSGLIARPEPPRALTDCWLKISVEERSWATEYLEALGLEGPRFLIALMPGASYGPAKRWAPDGFAAVADRLIAALNADVLIFGAHSEKTLAEQVAQEMTHTPTVIAGEATLGESMSLLEQCRLVVTNDSGSMHVAAALALPVVAIFGSTDPQATGPLGPYARIVQTYVPCNPCGLRMCPIDFRCMSGVTVDMVYRTALELVKSLKVTFDSPARRRR
jgi:heptosyltransferase II